MAFDVGYNMISSITRLLAALLAVAGLYWGGLLILSIVGGIGVYLNLAHLPGWACLLGWWLIALGKPLPMSEKLFWILSSCAHMWLLFHSYFLFTDSRLKGVWQVSSIGIGIALVVSIICALLQSVSRNSTHGEQDPAPNP